MIMYENYQYGNYRRGCGTLKAPAVIMAEGVKT